MQKYIVGENGIGYILGEDGLYYSDLRLPKATEYPMLWVRMMNNIRHCAEAVGLMGIVYD